MSAKKTFQYYLEVEHEDGSKGLYSVHQQGTTQFIQPPNGPEHVLGAAAKSVEDEIRIVYRGKVTKLRRQ
jgi:hypothetical protein